ncbi:MAG: hypothetical protein Q9205_004687 [Flavoplaca limonia]
MARTKRIGLLAVFSTGMLAVVASFIRMLVSVNTIHDADLKWIPLTAITTCCELNIGLVCACMPAMPPFFRRTKQSLSILVASKDRIQILKSGSGNSPLRCQPSRVVDTHITTPSLHIKTRDYEELDAQKKEEAMV